MVPLCPLPWDLASLAGQEHLHSAEKLWSGRRKNIHPSRVLARFKFGVLNSMFICVISQWFFALKHTQRHSHKFFKLLLYFASNRMLEFKGFAELEVKAWNAGDY